MPPTEIPTLLVLVPLTAAAVAVALLGLYRRARLNALRASVAIVACVYGAGVLGHVLPPFLIDTDDSRSWRVWLHVVPFVDVAADPIGIILNMALFVPLGLLLPLVLRAESARSVLIHGLLLSLGIETVQFVADLTVSPGRVADIDDLIGNTVGTAIGYALFRVLVSVPAVSRLAARAALPRGSGRARAPQVSFE